MASPTAEGKVAPHPVSLRIDRQRITVTEAGRPLVRRVCAAFDRYFVEGEGRHSPAV